MTSLFRRTAALLCLFAAVLLAKDVKVFPVPGTDYAKYKTYDWLSIRLLTPEGIVENDDRIAPLLRASVDKMLQSKGMKKVESNGDVQVQSIVMYTPRIQLSGYLVMYGYDAFTGYGTETAAAVGGAVKGGTLAIALVDPKIKKGIWSGLAFEGVGMLGKIGGSVNKAVEEVFKKYPQLK
jgi:hypothetical protein